MYRTPAEGAFYHPCLQHLCESSKVLKEILKLYVRTRVTNNDMAFVLIDLHLTANWIRVSMAIYCKLIFVRGDFISQ